MHVFSNTVFAVQEDNTAHVCRCRLHMWLAKSQRWCKREIVASLGFARCFSFECAEHFLAMVTGGGVVYVVDTRRLRTGVASLESGTLQFILFFTEQPRSRVIRAVFD